ncbi:hypothetical protein [Humisphaera borealis]|uniref:Uncharacterized protein n=1 Tax=Humisphaera borealis TaxID=2807512 RepID=A0A7M2WYY8_9BACT|nr:hypothetical protein [Humisphaera borealis]QOV90061.1 hypothetical protein IPV69_01420 [Humisphaera borealis]
MPSPAPNRRRLPLHPLSVCAGVAAIFAGSGSLRGQARPSSLPAATLPSSSQPATVASARSADAPPATSGATQPGTRPASQPVYTLATPRETLKYFAAALRDGDVQRLRRAVISGGDADERMVTAIADMARALATLHAAAKETYGPDAAARFTEDTAAGFEQTLAKIDAAEVVIDHDAATVRYPDDKDHPYELRRVGEEWKVPATQFTQGVEPPVLERRIGELTVQTRIVIDMAREITTGKHKSADAAGLAWRSKMMAALSGDLPGSRAATKPKGQ